MQQLESKITMIQPDSSLWSERNMKSLQILHTDNIRSHPITGNSSASKKVGQYSPSIQIKNQLHSLQKSSDNFLFDKSNVTVWKPTTKIEDLPPTDEVVIKASEKDLMVIIPHKTKLFMQENSRVATENDSNDENQSKASRDLGLNTVASVSSLHKMDNSPNIFDNNESPHENQLLVDLP